MSYSTPPIVEVSHVIEAGMKTFPGLPEPKVEIFLDREASRVKYTEGTEFLIANLHLCGNTGTYVDAPFHRYAWGADLSMLPLEKLAHVPVEVVNCTDSAGRLIGPNAIGKQWLRHHRFNGKAVLFRTGWSRHWGTDRYFEPHPFLTADCCEELVRGGASFVGIDSLNIDDIQDLSRPAHSILLSSGVPVCEHMTNLAALPERGGKLHAVPIAWKGGTTFPVRAYVML